MMPWKAKISLGVTGLGAEIVLPTRDEVLIKIEQVFLPYVEIARQIQYFPLPALIEELSVQERINTYMNLLNKHLGAEISYTITEVTDPRSLVL